MALLKEIPCAFCGKKTKLLSRTKLKDGNYICSDCTSVVPWYIWSSVENEYTLENFVDLTCYVAYSEAELRPIFEETHHYYSIHIDAIHNLFYIGSRIKADTVFYHFKFIDEYELIFEPEEIKEGVLGDKVRGKILFNVRMLYPIFYYEEILDRGASAKAKKAFFGTKMSYENPKNMDEFCEIFESCFRADEDAMRDECENDNIGVNTIDVGLHEAAALFMIDDLDSVTLDELKSQRNQLIKTFHPDKNGDNNIKYSQKINAAYDLLKAYIEI